MQFGIDVILEVLKALSKDKLESYYRIAIVYLLDGSHG